MSGLYVLLLVAIWLGLAYGGYRSWRRFAPQWALNKRLYAALGLAAAALWILWPFWEVAGRKIYYDAQVNRLCEQDGGVKVYETVKLSAENFDKYGQINFYRPTQGENALGAKYVLKTDVQYFRRGDPSLRRYHVQVLRRLDGKLLGESVGYDRGGGDLPGPWHPSSYSCPQHHGESIVDKIFVSLSKE